jgi:hypothetical protein
MSRIDAMKEFIRKVNELKKRHTIGSETVHQLAGLGWHFHVPEGLEEVEADKMEYHVNPKLEVRR